jgi:hypothetical protein
MTPLQPSALARNDPSPPRWSDPHKQQGFHLVFGLAPDSGASLNIVHADSFALGRVDRLHRDVSRRHDLPINNSLAA